MLLMPWGDAWAASVVGYWATEAAAHTSNSFEIVDKVKFNFVSDHATEPATPLAAYRYVISIWHD